MPSQMRAPDISIAASAWKPLSPISKENPATADLMTKTLSADCYSLIKNKKTR